MKHGSFIQIFKHFSWNALSMHFQKTIQIFDIYIKHFHRVVDIASTLEQEQYCSAADLDEAQDFD